MEYCFSSALGDLDNFKQPLKSLLENLFCTVNHSGSNCHDENDSCGIAGNGTNITRTAFKDSTTSSVSPLSTSWVVSFTVCDLSTMELMVDNSSSNQFYLPVSQVHQFQLMVPKQLAGSHMCFQLTVFKETCSEEAVYVQ